MLVTSKAGLHIASKGVPVEPWLVRERRESSMDQQDCCRSPTPENANQQRLVTEEEDGGSDREPSSPATPPRKTWEDKYGAYLRNNKPRTLSSIPKLMKSLKFSPSQSRDRKRAVSYPSPRKVSSDSLDETMRGGVDRLRVATPTTISEEDSLENMIGSKFLSYHQVPMPHPRSISDMESLTLQPKLPRAVSEESEGSKSPATKRAFTEFHNSGRDTGAAFLGDDPSTSGRSLFWTSQEARIATCMSYSEMSTLMSSVEVSNMMSREDVEIVHKERVLQPVVGCDQWKSGRRYLIGPAALVACPFSIRNQVWQSKAVPAREAVCKVASRFQDIVLGDCLLSVSPTIVHGPVHSWSSARLVLRQNYLLEYDSGCEEIGFPRGYAHLESSTCVVHSYFADTIELRYFTTPCTRSDPKVLSIRLNESSERDNVVACLKRASSLTLDSMYSTAAGMELGSGACAAIVRGRRKLSDEAKVGTNRALKVFDKAKFWRHVAKGKERADAIVREASVQGTLSFNPSKAHPFVRMLGFFESSTNVVLELELLDTVDLFQYISVKRRLDEMEAASITYHILESLQTMSEAGLCHRDIKPKNVLMWRRENDEEAIDIKSSFQEETRNLESRQGVIDTKSTKVRMLNQTGKSPIKLCDFGMSAFVGLDGLVRGRCGTPGYVAPEIFAAGVNGGYGSIADVFSVGVTLYVMLCGYEPFYGETDDELIEANKRADIVFPDEDWACVSNGARDLVAKMLEKRPCDRISVDEAVKHVWLMERLPSNIY